ncbi:MAG: hypothetical protein WBW61_04505, partial [Rhodanobacteraceae bacterium]
RWLEVAARFSILAEAGGDAESRVLRRGTLPDRVPCFFPRVAEPEVESRLLPEVRVFTVKIHHLLLDSLRASRRYRLPDREIATSSAAHSPVTPLRPCQLSHQAGTNSVDRSGSSRELLAAGTGASGSGHADNPLIAGARMASAV